MQIHMVPKEFRFPKCNVRTVWNLYWGGRACDRIRPYRFLKAYDMYHKSDRGRWSKAISVVKQLISCIINHEDGPTSIAELASMPSYVRDDMFDLGVKELCSNEGVIPVRLLHKVGQLSYVTVYNNIGKDN